MIWVFGYLTAGALVGLFALVRTYDDDLRHDFSFENLVDRTRRLSPFGGETNPCSARDAAGTVRQNLTTSSSRVGGDHSLNSMAVLSVLSHL